MDVSKAHTIDVGLFDQNSAGKGVQVVGMADGEVRNGYPDAIQARMNARRQKATQGKTPYNGDDLVADGIHQVKSEPPYNGDDLVADGIHQPKKTKSASSSIANKPVENFRDSDFVRALTDPTQFYRVQEDLEVQIRDLRK